MKAELCVSVIGLGYIGLPTAVMVSQSGIRVYGYDVNQSVRATIGAGKAHIFEPGLDELVRKAIDSGSLTVHDSLQTADIYVICVPTPIVSGAAGHLPDLQYVHDAAKKIAERIKSGDVIILESTSPVGTVGDIRALVSEMAPGVSFHVAYCPERVIPGRMLVEFKTNPRIIGCDHEATRANLVAFYSKFTSAEVVVTDAKTAEMCKLAENAYRDVNIAFANEVSLLADAQGVDVWELRRLANLHPRVDMLLPGPGVGGHCISVDPWFLIASDSVNSSLLKSARQVNDRKPLWVITQCLKAIEEYLAEKGVMPTVAIYGIAFKPDVDDFRGSPSLTIAQTLLKEHSKIVIVEPFAVDGLDVPLVELEEAMENADIHIVLVSHSQFKAAALHDFAKDDSRVMLDFCGLTDSSDIKQR